MALHIIRIYFHCIRNPGVDSASTQGLSEFMAALRRTGDRVYRGGVYVQRPEFQDILALYKKACTEPEKSPEITEGGTILVKSDPDAAQIYIDGEYMGVTPMLIKLPMGKHHVLLQSDGYYQWEAHFELTEPVEIPLFAKLSPI